MFRTFAKTARVFLLGLLVQPAWPAPVPSPQTESLALKSQRAKRFMAEGEYSEAMIQYRVILANDPANQEAAAGVKLAQEAISKKEREREEKL